MRLYDIRILEPDTRVLIAQYTSQGPNGWVNPNALHVDLDIPTYALAEPEGVASIVIWGIGIETINQSHDLIGKVVQVYGGMGKGLPLSNPAQYGLLLEAEITQPFGNWQGVYQSLNLICQVGLGSQNAPKNIVLNWLAGQTLSTALQSALDIAFPDMQVSINITARLVQDHDEPAFFQTVLQLAQWIKQKSQALIGGTYQGVDCIVRPNQLIIYDGTTVTAPRKIDFKDLIGQPTWIGPDQIQFKTAMRADIQVSDYVELPPGQVTTTAQSYSQYRDKSSFTGSYQIIRARAIGSSRQKSGDAWVSVFEAFPIPKETADTQASGNG